MNQRRIIIGAMIGAIAISALSISLSLAWYSSSDRLRVSSFDIDMSGDVELLMSTSKELETFKEELTKEDLVEEEFLFSPVSSMYRNTWYDQKGDTPLFYDSSSPALDGIISQEEATTGFFQKRIYLLLTTFFLSSKGKDLIVLKIGLLSGNISNCFTESIISSRNFKATSFDTFNTKTTHCDKSVIASVVQAISY